MKRYCSLKSVFRSFVILGILYTSYKEQLIFVFFENEILAELFSLKRDIDHSRDRQKIKQLKKK